jgi:HK97 family phage portal protein
VLPNPSMVQKRFHPSQDPPAWFKEYISGGGTASAAGVNVTPDSAMRLTGALACIRIIADTESSLPYFTYRRLPNGGKEKAVDHYLYSKLHDIANPEMSAFTFRRTLSAHCASRGNGLAEIEYDGAGRVKALWPLIPDKTSLLRDPRTKKLYYLYTLPDSEGGQTVRLPYERIFHIKWLSQTGLWGMSPVQLAAESLGISLAAQEFTGRFFQNDASPRGVYETDNALSETAYGRLKKDIEDKLGGLENKHRFSILEEGLKFNAVSLSPSDILLLDLMNFGVEDVGRVWGISSDMLNLADKAATYASVEQFGIRFATHTVRPWVVNWDQEAHRSLLTESERKEYFVEHDLNGLLRGDFKTRMEGYRSGITAGWMVRNEAREFENLNPIEGLDEPLTQMNMTALSDQPAAISPDQQRSVMFPIYRDIFQRIARREQHDQVAAKFGEEHRQFVALQIGPALASHLALRGRQAADDIVSALAYGLADQYCREALNGQQTDWADRLSQRSDL